MLAVGDGVDQLAGTVLGVRGHEAQPVVAGDLVDLADQLSEGRPRLEPLTVAVDVLSEQGDILIALFDHLLRLRDDDLGLSAALSAAHIRHDAVGAEVVTAVHDRQPALEFAVAAGRDALVDLFVVVIADKDARAVHEALIEQLGELVHAVRAEYQADKREAVMNTFGNMLLLHHTAA